MTPALNKRSEKVRRIHPSCPLLPRSGGPSGAVLDLDLKPQLRTMDDSFAQFCVNLTSASLLDPRGPKTPLKLPETFLSSLIHTLAPPNLQCDEDHVDLKGWREDLVEEWHENPTHPDQGHIPSTQVQPPGEREKSTLESFPSLPASILKVTQEEVEAWRKFLTVQNSNMNTRTEQVKRRLSVLLAEKTLQHCDRPFRGLEKNLKPSFTSSDSPSPDQSSMRSSSVFSSGFLCSSSDSPLKNPSDPEITTEVQRMAWCGQVALRKLQEALDSDATVSSSDEEWEPEITKRGKYNSGCPGCDWTFHCERAKLGSHWTWIKLRLSELDLKIDQISHLHQHLVNNKGGVVLATSRPLADIQFHQVLKSEKAGSWFTARNSQKLDPDTEPVSPGRLLRNIERQSAQLSQIVNSLMIPPSLSPSCSPQPKRVFTRGPKKGTLSSSALGVALDSASPCLVEQKKRRAWRGGRRLSLSARTRPLVSYYKPRLYAMDQSSSTLQAPDWSSSLFSHPASTNSAHRSDWIQPPGFRDTPSVFNCTHQLQTGGRVHRKHSTPVWWARDIQKTPVHTHRRALKRRCHLQADLGICVSPVSPSTEDAHTHTPEQFSGFRRNCEHVYKINSEVLPTENLTTLNTLKKLQEILTPSWRLVSVSPVKEEKDSDQVELLSEEIYSSRHQQYKKQKIRRSISITRRSSRGHVNISGDSDQEPCSRTSDPPGIQTPWRRRIFPLTEEEEKTLRCDADLKKTLNMECSEETHRNFWSRSCVSRSHPLLDTLRSATRRQREVRSEHGHDFPKS